MVNLKANSHLNAMQKAHFVDHLLKKIKLQKHDATVIYHNLHHEKLQISKSTVLLLKSWEDEFMQKAPTVNEDAISTKDFIIPQMPFLIAFGND